MTVAMLARMRGRRSFDVVLVLAAAMLLVVTGVTTLSGRQERYGVLLLPQLAAALVLAGAVIERVREGRAPVGEEAEDAGPWGIALALPVASVGYILAAHHVGPIVATIVAFPALAVLGGWRRARPLVLATVMMAAIVIIVFLWIIGTWFPSDILLA